MDNCNWDNGGHANANPTVEAEGFEAIKISIVPLILISLPFMMIASNIMQKFKNKNANQLEKSKPTNNT